MLENILCKEAIWQKLKLKVYIIYELLMRAQEREEKRFSNYIIYYLYLIIRDLAQIIKKLKRKWHIRANA